MNERLMKLLSGLAFFAADGMAEPGIVKLAKEADELLTDLAKQQAHPVAWRKRSGSMWLFFADADDANAAGAEAEPLYTEPPHPRAQLMRVAEAVFDTTSDSEKTPEAMAHLAAIVDAEAAQPVAQQYLLGGRRFKVTHSQDHGFAITGLPQTMNGQWVAFVDATDNCHMQQQQPASAQLVAVPEGWQLVPKEPTRAMLDAAHTNFRKDIEIDPLLKTSYRAMLSAAQKPDGGE